MNVALVILIMMGCVTMTTPCSPKGGPKKPRHPSCPVDDKRKMCTMDGMIVCEGFVKFYNCQHDTSTSVPMTRVDLEFCGKDKVTHFHVQIV